MKLGTVSAGGAQRAVIAAGPAEVAISGIGTLGHPVGYR